MCKTTLMNTSIPLPITIAMSMPLAFWAAVKNLSLQDPLFAFEMINCISIASHFMPVSQVHREQIPEHFSKIIGLLSPMHF